MIRTIERSKIIYVDDDEENLKILKFLLPNDCESFCFDRANKALDKIKEISPSVVLSDHYMPEMTGVEFLAKVKLILPNVPLILISGGLDYESVVKAKENLNLFAFISKPYSQESLNEILARAILEYSKAIKNPA